MNPYQSLRDCEEHVYTLPQQFPMVVSSTLIMVRRGARMATVTDEIRFAGGYRLVVKERLTFDSGPLVLTRYGYEIWRSEEQLTWYDSQPHPDDSVLAATAPHHQHIPPDIRHHRVPAPGLSFTEPNLPFLIQEMDRLLKG